jgi:hypothetical protein
MKNSPLAWVRPGVGCAVGEGRLEIAAVLVESRIEVAGRVRGCFQQVLKELDVPSPELA